MNFHRFSPIFIIFHRFSRISINFRRFSLIFTDLHRFSTILGARGHRGATPANPEKCRGMPGSQSTKKGGRFLKPQVEIQLSPQNQG